MGKCEQCIARQLSDLKALKKDELIKLAEVKKSIQIKKGEAIFGEGEHIKGVFCIKSGVGKLSKLNSNGKDQIVKLVKAGEMLGQRSIITEEATNLSAIALEDMEVCFVPQKEILGFFNENNEFSMNVMKTMCNDLKLSNEHVVEMAQKTVKERLAILLLHLEETFGMDEDASLKMHLSRDEMANMIGTATESCIRLLSEFNKNGWIVLQGKKIFLKNKKELKQMAL